MKPAARMYDNHECKDSHKGEGSNKGPILPPCNPDVLIDGIPAATIHSECLCGIGTDKIISGSTTVIINGKPAVRIGDKTSNKGQIISGSSSVLIGD